MNTDPRRLKNSMNDGCFVVSDSIPKAVYPILNALAFAAIQLRGTLMRGHFDSSVVLPLGQNSDGDSQVPMDIYADRLFHDVLKDQDVAWYASEEREEVAAMRKAGRYALAIDPLDGSSNVNINISVGSIFSLYPAESTGEKSFLRPPRDQIAAGYFIYGPQTWLMLTCGNGVMSYIFDPEAGMFRRENSALKIPDQSLEFAINMSNYHHWSKPVRAYVDACINPNPEGSEKPFNMRWIASLVAEAQRILTRGGVFLYPNDRRPGYEEGRLRHVYECGPIAFLIEQAGGLATDCRVPIMEKTAQSLHSRTPFVFGCKSNVDEVRDYHDRPDHELSALFAARGLFRGE